MVAAMGKKKDPILVKAGFYEGHLIRRARVAGKCEENARCETIIQPGDHYVEGHGNGTAGIFGKERICLRCGGVTTEIDDANR